MNECWVAEEYKVGANEYKIIEAAIKVHLSGDQSSSQRQSKFVSAAIRVYECRLPMNVVRGECGSQMNAWMNA